MRPDFPSFCDTTAKALLAFAVSFPAFASAMTTGDNALRFHIMLGGQHVGAAQWQWRAGGEQPYFADDQELRIAQRGGGAGASHRYRIERDPKTGALLVQRRLAAGPSVQEDEGRIEKGRLHLDRSLAGQSIGGDVPADAVMPYQLIGRLHDLALTTSRESAFPLFDLDGLRTTNARTAACGENSAAGLHCVRLATPTRREDWYFSADGRLQRIESEFAGLPMVMLRCESDCDRRVAQQFDVIGHLVVASPYRIPKDAAQKKLRFLLSREDGQTPVLVPTGDQLVVANGAQAVVTVCRNCGEAEVPSAEELARYRQPNAWVQSDHAEIRRLAARVGSQKHSVDSRMRRSVALMIKTLKPETGYIGYADALQTLRLGRGDCIGHAMLLAALARAQGIPARIVVGIAYADRFSGRRDVFSPHAWVQAWDGKRWISYDSALQDFDSTHVALAIGDGNPNQVGEAFLQLSRLKLERVGVVKPD
ncbi:transglutaminase-like domain-containing protein [Arenimonas sp.]|uniref:transglutaminase-like domain-containing protein n=1 Tax=Arenimonas sp. TaxID=1872635 RepID=UPI0039E6228E